MACDTIQPVLAAASDLLIYIFPTVGSMLLFYGIFQIIVETRTNSKKKVKDRLRGTSPRSRVEKEGDNILRRGAFGETKSFADAVMGKLSIVPKLQTTLDQADLQWSASQTLLNLVGAGMLTAVGMFVAQFHPLAALGTGFGVFILPLLYISFRRNSRMSKLCNQLPDVFEMMSQALRAGHSLGGAIQLVAEQLPPPIATEFAQVYHEQNLGVKVEDALQAMASRVDSMDVKFFVTAVMIQRQTGGDLAEVLDNIGQVIRGRIELAGMVKGLYRRGATVRVGPLRPAIYRVPRVDVPEPRIWGDVAHRPGRQTHAYGCRWHAAHGHRDDPMDCEHQSIAITRLPPGRHMPAACVAAAPPSGCLYGG